MAKFLNKKEQVIDFKLTPYGKYKLSVGTFKPYCYAFYDDGVLYDGKYCDIKHESQNSVHERIKNKTTYLESLVVFDDVETSVPYDSLLPPMGGSGFTFDEEAYISPGQLERDMLYDEGIYRDLILDRLQQKPTPDVFKFNSAIGDAYFDGEQQQSAPAWKVVTLQGEIDSSSPTTIQQSSRTLKGGVVQETPQVNISLYYTKKVEDHTLNPDPRNVIEVIDTTAPFGDGKVIQLVSDDLVVYAEELNTELLTENFDIEIFEVETETATFREGDPEELSSDTDVSFEILLRKFFKKENNQVVNGLMTRESLRSPTNTTQLSEDAVEYYFDVLTDIFVEESLACKGASVFNKTSYYIDLDFDCDEESKISFYDIYGDAIGEPEICD